MAKEIKLFKSNKEYLQYLKGGKAEELVMPDYEEPTAEPVVEPAAKPKKTSKKKEA